MGSFQSLEHIEGLIPPPITLPRSLSCRSVFPIVPTIISSIFPQHISYCVTMSASTYSKRTPPPRYHNSCLTSLIACLSDSDNFLFHLLTVFKMCGVLPCVPAAIVRHPPPISLNHILLMFGLSVILGNYRISSVHISLRPLSVAFHFVKPMPFHRVRMLLTM